jgi:ATP-dependent helicase HrpB
MLATGLHPRLAHMLVRARGTPLAGLAARLAALLSERDLLRAARDPDMRTRLEGLRGAARNLDPGALARVRELARRLGASGAADPAEDDAAGAVLAWAYPDRIAQLRAGSGGAAGQRYLLANGRGAMLEGASTLMGAQYLVALDLDDAEGAAAHIRLAAPVTRAQIEQSLGASITQGIETGTDPKSGALRAREVRRLDALVLEERRAELDPETVTAALLEQLRRDGLDALPWGEGGDSLRARLRFIHEHREAARDLPAFDEATLLAELPQWLAPYLHGLKRLDQLPPAQLREALLSRLTHAQRRQFDEFAPTHVTVPTGSRIAVDYVDDNAPAIEVRMQEVFGLADTPRIAGGRVPITLKLLSPARRPMQITRDLAGFWKGSYAEVRKDMRGRYPRHYWPENPLEAEPVRGVRPRPK